MKCSRFFSTILLLGVAVGPYADAHCAYKPHKSHLKKCDSLPVNVIDQDDIPLVIYKSGEYVLKKSVYFKKSGSAITITADNVKLNLRNASIFLTDPTSTGITVQGATEVVIEADKIINTSPLTQTGNGIAILNSNDVIIRQIFTENSFNGLLIANSTDVSVFQSQFSRPSNAGANVVVSTDVLFDSCDFTGSANNGAIFTGANQDCKIVNCSFPDAEFTNLLVQQISGMVVEKCSFTNVGGDPTKPNLVQFGDVNGQIANNVIFQECTIVNRPAPGGNTNPEGLGLTNASGVLVDSCVIDIDNTGQPQEIDLSGIHIGDGSGVQVGSNVTIRNTICKGPSTDGFYPDIGSSNIVIDSCLASNALKDGIFLAGTSASVVQNCTVVNNGTNGIFLGEKSANNAIINNVVSSNGFNIITPITDPSLPPTGTGIGINADSSFNLIQNNQVFSNAVDNIENDGTSNVVIGNTEF